MPILIALLVFVVFVFAYIFYAYNRLTQLRNACETEWADVDILLTKRADLIPNIIEVVKGYAKHEREVLENASRARAEAIGAGRSKTDAEASLSEHVRTIFALREQYPDLKANEDFLRLQSELFSIEDEIAEVRHNYNDTVKAHNDFVFKFPANMVAAVIGFAPLDTFEFTGSQEAPTLDVSPGKEQAV